jgi:hypothetical protein
MGMLGGTRPRTRARLAAAALTLGASLVACSGHSAGRPSAVRHLVASTPYEQAALRSGAAALWSLRDATQLSARDEVADLVSGRAAATVVGGTIAETAGPGGVAARFFRSGRLVTPLDTGLASTDAFSIELDLRADACVAAWGRVLGTTTLVEGGREGFEFLHFPKQFQLNPCRFGVEFWHLGTHLGGCHPHQPPVVGVWSHWAVVYAAGRVTCYRDGTQIESTLLAAPRVFRQPGPLGIGGSGSGFQGPLDGASLGEVAFYRKALSPAEVRQHALLARSGTPTASPSPSAHAS